MPTPPEAPKFFVHYRLLPPLSRGIISEHFYDVTTETLPDGSVEIKGYCDDAWEAGRLLLAYGEYCIVLGGDEVSTWMDKTVTSLIKNYQHLKA